VGSMTRFVPWQNIADWHCKACGYCCKLYSVVLSYPECVRLTQEYGPKCAVASQNGFLINRYSDGTCAFLGNKSSTYFCALQNNKPEACKVWPFKVCAQPKYGEEKLALYMFQGKPLYVYGDNMCNGLRYGSPTWEFKNQILIEYIEISLRLRGQQSKTTRSQTLTTQSFARQLFPK
jgi:Fe-S-cluster containining protein